MTVNRNQPCPCGSGKRFKHCCGSEGGSVPVTPATADFAGLMKAALAAQHAAQLVEAERLYTAALALRPDSFDALHMLGVLRLQAGDPDEALRMLLEALPHKPADYPAYVFNLKLCIAGVIRHRGLHVGPVDNYSEPAFTRFSRPGSLGPLPASPPSVSVILCPADCIGTMAASVESLLGQTYRSFEVMVLDGAISDATRRALLDRLAAAGIPVECVGAGPHDMAHGFNRALDRARGAYVTYIDSKTDRYVPQRIEYMVRMLEHSPMGWGFSNVDFIDRAGNPMAFAAEGAVAERMRDFDAMYAYQNVFEAFLNDFSPQYLGNLFFRRDLWSRSDVPPDVDADTFGWAISLQFGRATEPAYLDAPVFERLIEGESVRGRRHASAYALAMRLDWDRQAPALPHIALARAGFWRRILENYSHDRAGLDLERALEHAAQLGYSVPPAIQANLESQT